MNGACGASDTGRVRAHNEDHYLVDAEAGLFVVADGMGGHKGGRTAARLAVATLAAGILAARDQAVGSGREPAMALADLVQKACQVIYEEALADASLRGMGTTVTALWLLAGSAAIAHVGDSRCYLLRDGRLTQLTDDHSLVNEQVRAGELTAAEARLSPMRNVITRSVGFEPEVLVDTVTLPVELEDRFLLCSDGLTNHLGDGDLLRLLAPPAPAAELPAQLIDAANQLGGEDNITAVVVAGAAAAAWWPKAASAPGHGGGTAD